MPLCAVAANFSLASIFHERLFEASSSMLPTMAGIDKYSPKILMPLSGQRKIL